MAETILVVDDDQQIRDLLKFFLETQGYEILEAHNGTEALEYWKQFQPPLIVLDYQMPDITGVEVCAQIRRDDKLKQPKVIMCTAQAAMDRVQSLLAGADEFVNKPIDMPELLKKVQKLLGGT